jgi:hypothetical protein
VEAYRSNQVICKREQTQSEFHATIHVPAGKLIDNIANFELQLVDHRKENDPMLASIERLNQRIEPLGRRPQVLVAQTTSKQAKMPDACVVLCLSDLVNNLLPASNPRRFQNSRKNSPH